MSGAGLHYDIDQRLIVKSSTCLKRLLQSMADALAACLADVRKKLAYPSAGRMTVTGSP